jgi:hypothetical protein
MFTEYEHRVENLTKSLVDIDITEPDFWVGITDFSYNKQSLIFNGNQIILPEKIRFPIVRFIDEETILVAASRAGRNEKNAWIIKSSGEVMTNFSIGDAIENIVITKDFIVAAYFDEAAACGEGIEIFNFSGERLFGYLEIFGSKEVLISDCYASALVKENKIIFCPYTEFPLVLFDVEAKTQQIWQPPSKISGSKAITKQGNKIYFHSPYHYEYGIYEWKIGSEEVEKVATYSSRLRGLSNGRFLAQGNSGYTIISFV